MALDAILAKGTPLNRGRMGLLANSIGASLSGDHIVWREGPAIGRLHAEDDVFAKLPERAAPLFRALLAKPSTPSDVKRELDAWRTHMMSEAEKLPHVERDLVDKLFKQSSDLLARCAEGKLDGQRARHALAALR